jgi:hypothetical protein
MGDSDNPGGPGDRGKGSAALATEPAPVTARDAQIAQIAELLREVVIVATASTPPPALAPRPSLPVQAARSTVKLTRLGLAVLGLIVAIAELVGTEHRVLRFVLDALREKL